MDKIPVELLERICNVSDDKMALKAMRLVNKHFANIAERYLFRTLIVFQRTSSWARIESIAQSPRLKHLVRKLELVPMIVDSSTPLRSPAFPWLPRTALSLHLPKFSEIETAWPPELYRGEREGNSSLSIVDLFGPSNELCNVHLSFALRVLHYGRLQITTLELHQYREILLHQIHPVPTLIHLKHLKLHFRHPFDVEHKRARAMSDGKEKFDWTLAPHLAKAENIKSLILTQDRFTDRREDECVYSFDIVPILSTASWPKLRSVWFGGNFARSTRMLQFMMMHGKSLRTIHLDHPVGPEIPWQRLASDLRTQYANHDCVISSRDDTIFHAKSACIEE